ncbi:hypothetical protein [Manganibacter manganicus]|uniref:Uncharacterized protein n=1 Tax=Manganibacter manganicus TaxID=1873176 RepID=A0A1V8RM39_9HYPH|nr:hypothetical protein [Pseudaminobacter manganicus]OQM74271.1 hypothetical protein BFN67_05325 [Pseudaminobacter manganicus]
MALFKFMTDEAFRVRSPERDRKTDSARQAKLRSFLAEFRTDIAREHDGLRARHERVTTQAAFSQQALENGPADATMSASVDDLTASMMRYADRLKALEEQIAFVTAMCERADRFPLENVEVEDPAEFAGERRINSRS